LDTTLETAEHARRAIQGVDGVEAVFTTIGNAQSAGPGSGGGQIAGEVRKGTLTLVLAARADRPDQQSIERALRPRLEEVPGARFSFGAGAPGAKLQIILSSQDAQALKSSAQAIERDLRLLPFLSGIISTASLERPEITVRPDSARAAERGVRTQSIGETLRIALAGDFDAALAKLNLDRRQIDIRVLVPV
jgi:multidrug efflux pump subunit AcrB